MLGGVGLSSTQLRTAVHESMGEISELTTDLQDYLITQGVHPCLVEVSSDIMISTSASAALRGHPRQHHSPLQSDRDRRSHGVALLGIRSTPRHSRTAFAASGQPFPLATRSRRGCRSACSDQRERPDAVHPVFIPRDSPSLLHALPSRIAGGGPPSGSPAVSSPRSPTRLRPWKISSTSGGRARNPG